MTATYNFLPTKKMSKWPVNAIFLTSEAPRHKGRGLREGSLKGRGELNYADTLQEGGRQGSYELGRLRFWRLIFSIRVVLFRFNNCAALFFTQPVLLRA